MTLRILSPAKINLFLYVIGRRPDGYHELISLMCRIDLYDEIVLKPTAAEISLKCSDPVLPVDDRNLALRAARRYMEACGRSGGVQIHLTKRIPVAAGLGGGSSNAASVLLGLDHLHGGRLPREQLMRIGRSLGADVPFFIFQSPALATGIGEQLEAYPGLTPWQALIVCPPFPVSTRMVYQNLNLQLTNRQKQPTKAHLKQTTFNPSHHLYNDLEAVTLALHPELAGIKDDLRTQGAVGALMSGSGPSVFGIFPDAATACRAAAALPTNRGWRRFSACLLTGPVRMIREI
jgi:4-diphosphocytidyl-2-C-methyl-D-erythritol kinase